MALRVAHLDGTQIQIFEPMFAFNIKFSYIYIYVYIYIKYHILIKRVLFPKHAKQQKEGNNLICDCPMI